MKRIHLLWSLCLALFALTGCDTNLEEIDTSFYNVKPTFNPIELQQQYRVTYNGSENPYISRSEKTFKLEIFKNDDATNTPVLTENECPSDKAITLFRPINQELAIYKEDAYKSIKPSIIFFGDPNQYSIRFKTYIMIGDEINYIPISELPGDMTIVNKDDEATPLFTQTLTAGTDGNINIMQLDETTFVDVPEDNEPDPANNRTFKVRLFYTDTDFSADELKIDFYRCDYNLWWGQEELQKYGSPFIVKKGEISDYIELEFLSEDAFTGILCDITDAANPNNIITTYYDCIIDFASYVTDDGVTSKYKKCTMQLLSGPQLKVLDGLSTKWQ